MDRRINYRIVLDTETAPIDRTVKDVSPENMLAYDYGWAVVDKNGNVYKTRSFVNADIFLGEKERMQSSYYAKKIPKYWEDIKSGNRILTSYYKIKKAFYEDIKEFEVKEVYAHNMRFDYGATKNTNEWITKYKYFFPYGIEICDTMKMARQVIATKPTYIRFCQENGYLTRHKTPRPQLKAEVLYKYISGDNSFVESHMGLEDVMIEKEIMAYCFRQHKKMERRLWAK